MLQALRRIEDRRQRGQEPTLLVRPRRLQPAERRAAGDISSETSAAPNAAPARPVAQDAPPELPVLGTGAEPAAPQSAGEPTHPSTALKNCAVLPHSEPGAPTTPVLESAVSPDRASLLRAHAASVCPEPVSPPEPLPSQKTIETAAEAPSCAPRTRRLDAQFSELAAQMLARVPASQPAVVGLCALEPASLAAVAPLAVALVRQLPGEVVLVEADPFFTSLSTSLAERLGTYANRSSRIPLEVVRSGTGWSRLARPTGVPRLSVLPNMARVAGIATPESLALRKTAFEDLRQQHQLVLVAAGPPIPPTGRVPLEFCDGVFLLATLRQTGTRQARRLIQSIRWAGGTVWGLILVDPA